MLSRCVLEEYRAQQGELHLHQLRRNGYMDTEAARSMVELADYGEQTHTCAQSSSYRKDTLPGSFVIFLEF